MAIFEFSKFELPPLIDALEPKKYREFKDSLLALIISQRIQIFNDEGDPEWKTLKHSRERALQAKVDKAQKRRKKPIEREGMGGIKILQDTGVLRSSFIGPNDKGAVGEGLKHHEEWIQENEVGIGTNVEYARIHNEGGTINWVQKDAKTGGKSGRGGFGRGTVIPAHTIKIPARPFDTFSDENLNEIQELAEAYLNGKL